MESCNEVRKFQLEQEKRYIVKLRFSNVSKYNYPQAWLLLIVGITVGTIVLLL